MNISDEWWKIEDNRSELDKLSEQLFTGNINTLISSLEKLNKNEILLDELIEDNMKKQSVF